MCKGRLRVNQVSHVFIGHVHGMILNRDCFVCVHTQYYWMYVLG